MIYWEEHDRRIVILSTLSSYILPSYISRLSGINSVKLAVILDAKDLSTKQKKVWHDRTRGLISAEGLSLYGHSDMGLCFYLVKNHNSNECCKLIETIKPELIINGGTPRKLKTSVLNKSKMGVINVHPGILPKYRGSCCVEWAIYNDDPVGNTAHFMTTEYDAGPIIDVESYRFPKGISY